MFNRVYHIKSIANVIAFSILYVKHPRHNNQQCNAQAALKKKKDYNPF